MVSEREKRERRTFKVAGYLDYQSRSRRTIKESQWIEIAQTPEDLEAMIDAMQKEGYFVALFSFLDPQRAVGIGEAKKLLRLIKS